MKYRTPPMDHQADEMENWDEPARGIFWDMGVGKTWLAINTIGKLFANRRISGVIISAPKGMMHQWIEGDDSEWHKHSPIPAHRVAGYTWNASMTKKNLEAQENVLHPEPGILDVVVVNTEAIITKKCQKFLGAFVRNHKRRVFLCIDEAHMIKNHSAKRSRTLTRMARQLPYRRALTGTPITNSPMDVFGIFKFLDDRVLGKEMTVFRSKYAKVEKRFKRTANKTVEYPVILGYRNLGHLRKTIEPYSSRVLKKDVLDLPPLTYQTLMVELGKEQRRIYQQMLDEAIVEIENELMTKTKVAAPSILARLTRLKQIACGFLPDPDTGLIVPLKDSMRDEQTMEFLSCTDNKVIVWFDFRYNVENIAKRVAKEYGKDSYVTYTGGTKDRNAAQMQFRKEKDCRFFLATTQTGQLGLNLVEAVTTVFYSQSYNLGDRLQATDRFYRKGQEKPVTVWDVLSPGTIDIDIRDRLIQKKGLADLITDGQVIEWLKQVKEKSNAA